MPDLQLDEPQGQRLAGRDQAGADQAGADQAGPGQAGQGLAAPADWDKGAVRAAAARLKPAALWRDHRLFAVLALLSLLPRVLAALAFRPGLLTADSFLYMQEASKRILGDIRPSGYSFFLGVLQPLPHPLLAVTTVQHLMGIAIAAIVYGLLRYWGLPAWGASLAALPTLFDPRQVALESYILPDTLFSLVLMIVVVLLLTRHTPRRWQCAVAGLLLAYVSVLRSNGLPLALVAAIYLLVRRVGWRALAAGALAFVLPLLGYVWVFHSEYGQFNISSSDGIFLWSGTTGFANCAIIKPPPQLLPLCPDREKSVRSGPTPPWSVSALLNAPAPAAYLWAPDVWWRNDAHPGINSYNDKLGMQFAIDAIKAQPLDYLRVTARDVLLLFLSTDRPLTRTSMSFTPHGRYAKLPYYYANYLKSYAGTTENTHAVQPYAYFMFLYEQPIYFPGLVFFAVLVAGLAGILRTRRRWPGMGMSPALLPWLLAAVSIVIPALLKESLYRYAMVAIPLACLAAGLAFVRHRPQLATPAPAIAQPGSSPSAAAAPAPATAPADLDPSSADLDPSSADLDPSDPGPTDPVAHAESGPESASNSEPGPSTAAQPGPTMTTQPGPSAAAKPHPAYDEADTDPGLGPVPDVAD